MKDESLIRFLEKSHMILNSTEGEFAGELCAKANAAKGMATFFFGKPVMAWHSVELEVIEQGIFSAIMEEETPMVLALEYWVIKSFRDALAEGPMGKRGHGFLLAERMIRRLDSVAQASRETAGPKFTDISMLKAPKDVKVE